MKTYDFSEIALYIFIALAIGFMIGNGVGIMEERNNWQPEAIQLGYAYHEPINGKFQWKTNIITFGQ